MKQLSLLLNAINEVADAARDLQELIRSVLRELADFPDAEHYHLAIFDEDRELVVCSNLPQGFASIDFSLAQQAIQTHKVVYWSPEDTENTTTTTTTIATPQLLAASSNDFINIRYAVYAPLISKDTLLGVIYVATTKPSAFFENQAADWLKSVAGVITAHLKQHLHDGSLPNLPSVFISYAHEDKTWVKQFGDDLRRRQIKVWYDIRLKAEPGENYDKLIKSAIESKHTFIVVISPYSNTSEAVKNELAHAQQLGKLIIPLKSQPCQTPKWIDEVQLQYLNFWDDYDTALNNLVLKLGQKSQELAQSIRNSKPVPDKLLTTPKNPNNLAISPTSFIGRSTTLAQLKCLLESTSLLTLMGAGGIGKTRLALEAGREFLSQYIAGVWFVDLTTISDPSLVVQTVREVLGIKEESAESPQNLLLAYLKTKQLMLILDNCEHLIDSVATLVMLLIQQCAGLKVLATSREALLINGETIWQMPSLIAPNPTEAKKLSVAQLTQYEAVQLFSERAAAAKPNFQVTPQNAPAVAKLCFQLDGIPLALELAAHRMLSMTVEEIVHNLDKRFTLLKDGGRAVPSRQQTLEALIKWSYDLLSPQEQILWEYLSIFVGGWTLEAAVSVCSLAYSHARSEGFEVLDLLSQLVNKSLVLVNEQNGTTRYRMLESIRQYGRMRLLEKGETENIQALYAAYNLELVEKAERELAGAAQKDWLTKLENDYDNIRAVLAWTIVNPADYQRIEMALRISSALWLFWSVRGYLGEAQHWLETALEAINSPHHMGYVSINIQIKAFNAAGIIFYKQGNYSKAKTYYETGLDLARKSDDKLLIARFLSNLGVVNRHQGNVQIARLLYEESLSLCRELRVQQGVGNLLNNLGEVAGDLKDYEAAEVYLQESISLQRTLGNQNEIALSMSTLANILIDQQQYEEAYTYLSQSLKIFHELDNQELIACSLEFFAGLGAAENEPQRAVQLAGAASRIREEIGAPLSDIEQARLEQRLSPIKALLSLEEWATLWQMGRAKQLQEAVTFAFTH
jgi:non-specific serine/threonine protein kinase